MNFYFFGDRQSGVCDPLSLPATKQDLLTLEYNILMKLSKVKTDVTAILNNLTEGLDEINARLTQLVEDSKDPEITDEAFTASLAATLEKSTALANVANPAVVTPPVVTPPIEPPVEDPSGEPVTEPNPPVA
jgi:hypothetical protein